MVVSRKVSINMEKEKDLTEKRLSSQRVYHGRILDLFVDEVELPNGRQAQREKVSHLGSVGMVPLGQEGQVILIRQYRYPVEEELIEIPAGKLDPGEDPWECARRETEEEIGLIPGRLVKLATFYTTPGFCNENFYLFLALDLKKGDVNHDDDEFMVIKRVSLERAIEMLASGEIRDAKTIIGLFLAREWLRKNNITG